MTEEQPPGETSRLPAESDARHRRFLEHAPVAMVIMKRRPDDQVMYEYMNLACEQAYGEPRAHFIGCTLHDVWPKHVADRIESQFGACRQSGSPFPFTVETVVNGALRYRDGTLSPLDQNPETGNADRILICTWDVTHKILLERQVAEQHAAIAQSEANARLILDTSKDMVSRVAADGTRLYASAATQRIFGISQQDFMQMHYAAVIHPDDLPVVRDVQTRLLAGELAETTFAYRIRHPERGERWLESDVVAVSDAGGGYISITRDITERVALDMERQKHTSELRLANAELERLARHMGKARKAAEQASRAKTRFLAGMSHELRTPLNGILGYAQLLRMDGQLTPSQAVRVQAMQSAGNHLLEMISCVLDLSEIETEGATLELASFDLPAVVEACMDIVRPAAEAKGLALRLGLGTDLPRHVVSSMTRLRQVLLNLLGNAVKYTPAGAVDLRVLVAAGNSGTPRLRLEVADTGPGIPPAKCDLLFEEFERLGAEASSTAEGAGLGLSLAKRLATLLGGTLGYHDNAGGGSLFFLDLPLVIGTAPAPDPLVLAAERPATAPAARAGLPILVVDDGAMNRDIAATFIASAGYQVTCADCGEAAVALAADNDYALILMDVRMPGIDGLEATRRIRALSGPRSRVPVVALTAQAFNEQIAACRAAGMESHVVKPFTLQALLDAIERSIAGGTAPPAAAAAHVAEADILDFDLETFVRIGSMISSESMDAHLGKLWHGIEALRRLLRTCDFRAGAVQRLVADVHHLGGNAGMFGFERLAHVSRHFERAVALDPAEALPRSAALDDALRATLAAMERSLSYAPELAAP